MTKSHTRFFTTYLVLWIALLMGFGLRPAYGANIPPTVSLTSPVSSTVGRNSNITLSATATDSDGISTVEFYQGTTQLSVTSFAPYSYNLINVLPGTYVYTAKATDRLGASTVSAPVTVVVLDNKAPYAIFDSPANGSTYTSPATIILKASAGDIEGGLVKVEFYNGTALLGTDTTSPFSITLSGVGAGTYAYSAKAYDNVNLTAVSSTINVTVSNPNTPPVVSLTSPANNSAYTAPAAITLNATASDSNGIAKVDFYNGTTLLGSDTTSPYSLALGGVAAGTYAYTAKATDTLNASTTSAAVNIVVSAPNTPPTVSLTSPANQSSYTAPAAITLNATASDSNGIAKVEFYRGATLLGTDTTSPYSLALTGVATGLYAYTAKATDTLNASTTSAAVNVTVKVSATAPVISALTATPQTLFDTATSQLKVTASDPDASPAPLSYSWSIVSGGGSLNSSTVSNPVYTPANVSVPTPVVIKATVSDSVTSVNQSITLTVNDTIVASDTVVYYHNDALGSPIAATNAAGALLWRETYRPYGERLDNQAAATTNPLWFTGKRQDPETGLVYMGARYYNPALGRFLSIDPVEPDENNLHSLNRYAYANNNPYKFTDPDGQVAETVIDVISLGLSFNAFRQDPGLANGLALAYDGFATAVPFLPGGLGIIRQAATKGGDVTQAIKQAADRGAAKAGEKAQNVAAKEAPNITKAYQRPSGATTKAQRESVQGKPCVDCGATTSRQVADHKEPLVKEYYRTGVIDKTRMRNTDSVQPQCPTCSARQGAGMSRFSRQAKQENGL